MIFGVLALLLGSDEIVLRARVDPFVTVVAGGASVGVDVARRRDPLRLSIATFVVDVPGVAVPFISDAPGMSLAIRESCVQVGMFASLAPEHRGFFFGPELYGYQLRYVDEEQPARSAVAHELYVHATAGYVWFPFSRGDGDHDNGVVDDFFVMPWATIGLPVFGSGGVIFGDGSVVGDRRFNGHATISIGLQL